MALDFFWPGRYSSEWVSAAIRPFRIPRLGATLPWGLTWVARQAGLRARGHFLSRPGDLYRCIDRGWPAIVLVRPDDFHGIRWFDLHYRVLVGYDTNATSRNLYFACSALGPSNIAGGLPGNCVIPERQFLQQWQTWLTPNWYLELLPGRAAS